MIVQIANNRQDRNMLNMGAAVLLIFIIYSAGSAFEFPSYLTYGSILVIIYFIIVWMRMMIRNKTQVKPFFAWEDKKLKVLKNNPSIRILNYSIVTLLTVAHFAVVLQGTQDIMPLVYDYGIGGAAFIVFQFLLSLNWHVGLSDKGIIFGSKYDSKLIAWENIDRIEEDRNSATILVHFKPGFVYQSIRLNVGKQFENALIILQQVKK